MCLLRWQPFYLFTHPGEPSDKPMDKIVTTIQEARARLTPQYGPHAVAFQFAQVW